jgi:hypothetical protein
LLTDWRQPHEGPVQNRGNPHNNTIAGFVWDHTTPTTLIHSHNIVDLCADMSLQVEDNGHRGRSRSPSRQEGERDRSRGRAPESDAYVVDAVRMPSPPAGFSYDDGGHGAPLPPRRPAYDYDDHRDPYRVNSPTEESYYRQSHDKFDDQDSYGRYPRRSDEKLSRRGSNRDREKDHKRDHDRDHDRDSDKERLAKAIGGAAAYLPSKYAQKVVDTALMSDSEKQKKKQEKQARLEEDLAYGKSPSMPGGFPSHTESPSTEFKYAKTQQWEHDRPDDQIKYNIRHAEYSERQYSPPKGDKHSHRDASPGPHRTSSKKHHHDDERKSSRNSLTVDPSGRRERSRSREPPVKGMSSLTVSTGHPSGSHPSLANAPGSPLLESYHGTYQSMSPMPSPLLLASNGNLSPIEPLSPGISDDERGDKKKRRARFSDPVDDAARLAKALKGERRAPDVEPLIEILPGMTHDQIMELRKEYKRLVKTGSEKKGVNIAKHIRARLKDEDPLLMKACYTVALGKWEGEAYWASFWYQGDKTRRELLIESIMGRTNDEIRKIKDGFSDKKYRDSLSQCMKTELKEDKFKKAVLLVLEEKRMEEYDSYGRQLPLDSRLIEDDVYALRKAVKSEKGGETAIIQIVVLRSDPHLREVLKLYERTHHSNFARDALRKSGNLVVSSTCNESIISKR